MEKFIVASMFMWIVPVAILYGFNHELFPGWSLFWSFDFSIHIKLVLIIFDPLNAFFFLVFVLCH